MLKLVEVPSKGEIWKDNRGQVHTVTDDRNPFDPSLVVVQPHGNVDGYSMRRSDLVERLK